MRPRSITCCTCGTTVRVPAKGMVPRLCQSCRLARNNGTTRPPPLTQPSQQSLTAAANTAANRAAAAQRAGRILDWITISTALRRSLA